MGCLYVLKWPITTGVGTLIEEIDGKDKLNKLLNLLSIDFVKTNLSSNLSDLVMAVNNVYNMDSTCYENFTQRASGKATFTIVTTRKLNENELSELENFYFDMMSEEINWLMLFRDDFKIKSA